MKIQLYIFSLLILLSSSNLLAVTTTTTLEKTKTEKLASVKKKPVKKFFQNMTQRVLENKIVKRLDKKMAKEKAGRKISLGVLSLVLSAVGLIAMFATSNPILVILGLIMGLLGFIFGIMGASRKDNLAMSIIGIVFGSVAVLVFIGIIIALLR